MQSVEIFSQSTINGLSEAEDILYDSVGMLYLAAHSGLAVLNITLPIDGVIGNLGQFARSTVDSVFNCGKLLALLNFFSLFKSKVRAVSVDNLVVLPQQLAELRVQGVREIKTAFDMDYVTNCYVQSAYEKLLALLGRMGFRYGTYVWDPRYKGLDDFIWARLKENLDRNS